jgi:hypothetical protein
MIPTATPTPTDTPVPTATEVPPTPTPTATVEPLSLILEPNCDYEPNDHAYTGTASGGVPFLVGQYNSPSYEYSTSYYETEQEALTATVFFIADAGEQLLGYLNLQDHGKTLWVSVRDSVGNITASSWTDTCQMIPTATPVPTSTEVPPTPTATDVPEPTPTEVPPTPTPTDTPVPTSTETPVPTATDVPEPTPTEVPPTPTPTDINYNSNSIYVHIPNQPTATPQ